MMTAVCDQTKNNSLFLNSNLTLQKFYNKQGSLRFQGPRQSWGCISEFIYELTNKRNLCHKFVDKFSGKKFWKSVNIWRRWQI